GLELHLGRREQLVSLAARVLGDVLLQLAAQRVLVAGELLAVRGRQVDGVLVRRVHPRDGDHLVVLHLLDQLARQLDRLHMGAKRTPEDTLEKAFQLVLDVPEDAHPGGVCPAPELYPRAPSARTVQVAQAASTSGTAATAGAGRSAAASRAAPRPAIHQRPRSRTYGIATAAAARTTASSASAGWDCSERKSASATAAASVLPAIPSPFGGVAPVNGSDACRSPATTAARTTAAAT